LEFETALGECGATDLVEEIDASLLQRLTIAKFSHLLDLLEDGSQRGIAACRSELRRARSDFDTEIHSRMRSDAQLSQIDLGHIEIEDEPVANVLLTGATGFFGPFLLSSLLKTPYSGRRKEVHFISSTFIFGWTLKGYLVETDNNDEMAGLDFGYAQTKWVAEQLVLSAQAMGLDVRIYRPSLISACQATVSVTGMTWPFDC
jgi:Male sterility protein